MSAPGRLKQQIFLEPRYGRYIFKQYLNIYVAPIGAYENVCGLLPGFDTPGYNDFAPIGVKKKTPTFLCCTRYASWCGLFDFGLKGGRL